MSGHQGPSLTLLRRAFAGFRLEARLRVRGTMRLLADYEGLLGPNVPQSDATLHPLALSRCDAVELSDGQWKVIRFGASGEQTVVASGQEAGQGTRLPERGAALEVALDRKPDGATRLFLDEREVWTRELSARHDTPRTSGVVGIEIEPHSHLAMERFTIEGKPQPAVINFLFSEAILGAGGSQNDWRELRGPEFRYGLATLAKAPGARVKWNVEGRQFALWSPRGPQFGKAQVKVDGHVLAELDLHAERLTPSAPIWKSPRLKDGPHAVAVTAIEGRLVVDSLGVMR